MIDEMYDDIYRQLPLYYTGLNIFWYSITFTISQEMIRRLARHKPAAREGSSIKLKS